MQRKLRLGSVIAAIAFVFSAGSARAYLDPATTILAEVASRRAELGFSTLVAEGKLPSSSNGEAGTTFWTAIDANRALRTEFRRPSGTAVELTVGRQRYRFAPGGSASSPESLRAAPLLELLGSTKEDPGGQRGLALLARMGVDSSVVSLARHEGMPAYVLGAAPGQLDRPQLWIDKELLVPVRWMVSGKDGLEDHRLYGFRMPTTGPWFPERIEIWRDGQLVSSQSYDRVRFNLPVGREPFTPPSR